jgi:hypothetical protein
MHTVFHIEYNKNKVPKSMDLNLKPDAYPYKKIPCTHLGLNSKLLSCRS